MTASAARATRPVSTYQPMTCGWIEACTASAASSRSAVPYTSGVRDRAAEPAVEAGQVGGPVRQSHIVGPQQGHVLVERRGVRGRGVEVVMRAATGGGLALGG